MWDEGLKVLSSATRLVIIGFSMQPADAYIKYFLAAGLQENISLREIVFIDPAVDQIRDRLRHLHSNQNQD
jgi:hypothetical protein